MFVHWIYQAPASITTCVAADYANCCGLDRWQQLNAAQMKIARVGSRGDLQKLLGQIQISLFAPTQSNPSLLCVTLGSS
jgi:hypothetical protein